MKAQRWYIKSGSVVEIYNHPDPKAAQHVSIVPASDLKYYRQNFFLQKCGGDECNSR